MSSRLNQASGEGVSSPIKYTLTFKGNNGTYKYYDRELSEEVVLKKVDIILLTEKKSITGFNDDSESRIYSNFISNTNSEELTVKAYKASSPIAKGSYSDIKEQVVAAGGKFTNNLICLANINKEWVVCNLGLTGSGLGSWLDFDRDLENKGDKYTNVLSFSQGEKKKKGAVKYVLPSISMGNLSAELSDLAEEKYKVVADYYSSVGKEEETSVRDEHVGAKQRDSEQIPSKPQTAATDFNDNDDLPF